MKVTGAGSVMNTLLRAKENGGSAVTGPGSKQFRSGGDPCLVGDEYHWTPEKLARAAQQANETMQIYNTNLQFKIHEQSGEYFCQVINSETKDVIREVPPEWLLDMVAHFRKMVGIVVDEIV